jgi:hypothetical protein
VQGTPDLAGKSATRAKSRSRRESQVDLLRRLRTHHIGTKVLQGRNQLWGVDMALREIILASGLIALSACDTIPNPSPVRGPYVRTTDYYRGYQFTGAFFTPNGDVELMVFNAPVPCDGSACASNAWQSLGTVKAGPVGGQYPFGEGRFQLVMQKEELTRRRGTAAPCYNGEWWSVYFGARDLATGKFTFSDGRPTSAGFFVELPRCR